MDSIFEALEGAGFNDVMASSPNEMHRYMTVENLTNQPLINPDEK